MKKLFGWMLIIFCSILLLIFVLSLISIVSGSMSLSDDAIISSGQLLAIILGFVIIISLLIFGLIYGIKKIKKEKPIEIVEYNKELNLNLSGNINYVDYRNLILGLSFKKPIYVIAFAITILVSTNLIMSGDTTFDLSDIDFIPIFFISIFILIPILTFIRIRNTYKTNKILHEQLHYKLTNDSIKIMGDTVETTQKWSHFYQLRETKNFFLFYPDKIVATFLNKKMFSESELKEFQEFTKSLNLKRV